MRKNRTEIFTGTITTRRASSVQEALIFAYFKVVLEVKGKPATVMTRAFNPRLVPSPLFFNTLLWEINACVN